MTNEQYKKNLTAPGRRIDVVLDTDAYNDIDDQFAISYMLRSSERICVKGICAAPFFNENSLSPEDGMNRSFDEIIKLLKLNDRMELQNFVFRGSTAYLENETTPQMSDAAKFMASLADNYSSDNPLYIVAIGAITNVASALLINPNMVEKTVIVWLGGHATHIPKTDEFNMRQDISAARIIFDCGIPLVQLPCKGVVDNFRISKPELEAWFMNKNPVATYLAKNTIECADSYAGGKPWTRVIWDVTAVAWLLNDSQRFMEDKLIKAPIPEHSGKYAYSEDRHMIKYVYHIKRDELMNDLIEKLTY